jgi:hypothetical protein
MTPRSIEDLGDDGALQDREPVVLRVVRVCVCSCLQPTDWVDPLWELVPFSLVHQPAPPKFWVFSPPDLDRWRSRDWDALQCSLHLQVC